MDLIGSVLPMEMNDLCTNKLQQTLKWTITGELICKWKKFNLLPLRPQISYLVCGVSVAAVQQHFAMVKWFLSYSALCMTHG